MATFASCTMHSGQRIQVNLDLVAVIEPGPTGAGSKLKFSADPDEVGIQVREGPDQLAAVAASLR
jgi:hypothetical protein